MAVDTEITVPIIDGSGATRSQLAGSNSSGNVVPETLLRFNGALVSAGNPVPVQDAAGETSLAAIAAAAGTQADATYTSGNATIVSLLKAIFTKTISTAISGSITSNDGGAAITGAGMPAGGAGVTGWLSAIWSRLGSSLAVTVGNFPATQPISAASLPLPTGAATSANQVAPTAAGTTATTASPIQGVTGGVPVITKVANYASAGASQSLTVTTTAAGLPSIPGSALYAQLTIAGGAVVYRDDGTAPANTSVQQWSVGETIFYAVLPLSNLQFILPSGGSSATVAVAYYK